MFVYLISGNSFAKLNRSLKLDIAGKYVPSDVTLDEGGGSKRRKRQRKAAHASDMERMAASGDQEHTTREFIHSIFIHTKPAVENFLQDCQETPGVYFTCHT
jgi:hypothetical protein